MLWTKTSLYILGAACLTPFFSDEDGKTQRCLQKSTYAIDIYVRPDRDVAETLGQIGIVNGTAPLDQKSSASGQKGKVHPALRNYFNPIISGMNTDLEKYGIQLRPFIVDPFTDSLADSDYKGTVCESRSAVSLVTESKYSKLRKKYDNNMGINLFLFSCISKVDSDQYSHVLVDRLCGRTIGILWQNNFRTAQDIRNSIIRAIAGHKSSYDGSTLVLDFPAICMFGNNCIGSGQSNNKFGNLLDDTIALVFDDEQGKDISK